MFRLKRGLLAAVSGFGLVSLLAGARGAWQVDASEGWRSVGLDWLVLQQWSEEWRWQLGLLGALLGLLMGLAFGAPLESGQRGSVTWRLTGCLAHPASAIVLMFLARYAPGISAATWKPRLSEAAPNVVLIVVDTWRADHTGFLGYERETTPGLDRLSASGVVFEKAKAQSGWTKPSVASLLTGMLPLRHGAVSQPGREGARRGVNLKPSMHSLTEVLRASGWETAIWSNNPNIIPERGFAQGAMSFVDYRGHAKSAAGHDLGRAEHMLPRAERWIQGRRDKTQPFFAYLHIMDPHLPYEAPAPFGGSFDKSDLDFQIGPEELQAYQRGELSPESVTPAMLQRVRDAYDEELLYVDHYLSAFIASIQGQAPNSIFVLVGDHGEEFLEHGQFGHAHALYEELVHVPLVLWAPGLAAGRIPYQVRLMDVMPTLLELCGLASSSTIEFQGLSLMPMLAGSEHGHRLAPMETGGDQHPNFHWRGISDGRYKLLRRELDLPGSKGAVPTPHWEADELRPYFRLFDLSSDPGESNDLLASEPERAEALFTQLKERGWYMSPEQIFSMAESGSVATEGEMHDLNALGYALDDEAE